MVRAAALALMLAGGAPVRSETLHLICVGSGVASRPTHANVSSFDANGNYRYGSVTGRQAVPFEDQLNIDIEDDSGKIKMPRAMLPPAHGGQNGWFEITNLNSSENEITGTIKVNFMHKPKLRLDRISGRVNIGGSFSGDCQPYDPATTTRKF